MAESAQKMISEEGSNLVSASEFLEADDITFKDVPVPEIGEGKKIRVKMLSGGERDAFILNASQTDPAREKIAFLALVCCDEFMQPIFTPADLERLAQKSWVLIDRIVEEGQRLNGLMPKSLEAAEQD